MKLIFWWWERGWCGKQWVEGNRAVEKNTNKKRAKGVLGEGQTSKERWLYGKDMVEVREWSLWISEGTSILDRLESKEVGRSWRRGIFCIFRKHKEVRGTEEGRGNREIVRTESDEAKRRQGARSGRVSVLYLTKIEGESLEGSEEEEWHHLTYV